MAFKFHFEQNVRVRSATTIKWGCAHVCVRTDFWTCEVRACDAKNGRNPCLDKFTHLCRCKQWYRNNCALLWTYDWISFKKDVKACEKKWLLKGQVKPCVNYMVLCTPNGTAVLNKVLRLLWNYLPKDLKTKGQLISKCFFGIFNSPKKRTKKSTLLLWYLKSNCFRSFFGRIEDSKMTFSKKTADGEG